MNSQALILGGRGAALAAYIVGMAFIACIGATAAMADTMAATVVASGELDNTTRGKRLDGGFEIVARDDGAHVLRFNDEFRASRGPDLKVFLSPLGIDTVTGSTAVDGSINLGELQATRGSQEYEIPADVDLSAFGSVIVHCEEFSVLWGGGDI
ncbi:MAG: DM13 domain-containing protein [Caulobacterales bacterium]|nr:DM13 domain-containing protein [Caulobacterales bacterium]